MVENNKNPVSYTLNKWSDAQRVDKADMDVEQDRNVNKDASIINNHFGSGIILNLPTQNVIFDSDSLNEEQAALLASGDLDGTGLDAHSQPTDTNLGNQLEVELTDSDVFGRLSVKVLIIGLDFESTPIMDTFYFHRNEKQVTKNHYTRVLTVFFNDFKGNNNCSRSLGGRITIKETESFQLSRDAKMVAQDLEPNLFFRDFKISGLTVSSNPATTLYQTLQDGMGDEYTVDTLGINTTVKRNFAISEGDVSTKIAQKFKATTNNIQKITLLLGVSRDDSATSDAWFDWSGEIVITIYELQTSVSCPSDIVPELAIEFDPNPNPVAQLSFSQDELYDIGYVLTDVLQPVDFVFSDTLLGSTSNSVIVPGRYYVVALNRAGSAGNGEIFTGIGNSKVEDARLTFFSNNIWVDSEEEDWWFQVWTAAAKVSDGRAYDLGQGIQIDKTYINDLGAVENYYLGAQTFADTGESVLNTGIVEAILDEFQEEQDERTGNPINSRKKYIPSFSFVTESSLSELRNSGEPLIIGCARDINPKNNPTITGTQSYPGLAIDDKFIIINPIGDLLSQNLLGSKLIPNDDNSSRDYRIFKVISCTDGYGDVLGDGVIDADDVARAAQLVGHSLSLSATQQDILDGLVTTLEIIRADVDGDGYVTSGDVDLITEYVAREINSFPVGSSFTHLEITVQQSVGRADGYFDCDGYVRLDGYTGQNIVDSDDLDPYELLYDGYISIPSINGADSAWSTVPFNELTYTIIPQPFWQDYLLNFSSEARVVPSAFTYSERIDEESCDQSTTFSCTNRIEVAQSCDPGRNDFMVPDNLIMRRGQILNSDGSHYKIDLEVAHIILELPVGSISRSYLNVFDKLVADAGGGYTSAGYNCLKFSDCSNVTSNALAMNQIRFGVAVKSIYRELDGYDSNSDGYIEINDTLGLQMDQTTGILTITVDDILHDNIYSDLITKIQITVYLKKAGWINEIIVIPSEQISGLFS